MTPRRAPGVGPDRIWLFVVARAHPDLREGIERLFRGEPRVRVIEDRRRDHGIAPGSGRPARRVTDRCEPLAPPGGALGGRSGRR